MSSTERIHPKGQKLGAKSSAKQVVDLLHAEDLRAVEAVGRVRRQIAAAAQLAANALKDGGRLIYAGAGTSGDPSD